MTPRARSETAPSSLEAMYAPLMSAQLFGTAVAAATVVDAAGPEAMVLDAEVDGLVVSLEIADAGEAL